jgi:hypothetical protein
VLVRDVYTLEFASDRHLALAFDRVLSCERLEDCVVDASGRRLTFSAEAPAALRVVERIYADGGLTWCLRRHLARDSLAYAGGPEASSLPRGPA